MLVSILACHGLIARAKDTMHVSMIISNLGGWWNHRSFSKILKCGDHESYYYSSLCAAQLMEDARQKTNGRAITRTNRARRQGQFQTLVFCNLGIGLHVIESASSRKNNPNVGTRVLSEQHVDPCDGEDFDTIHSRMRLACHIEKDDDKWNCSCPYFCKHTCWKHTVKIKKNMCQ